MAAQDLRQVLEKIYQERGFDFRQYKESSLRRRIERRLRATRVDLYEEYVKILDKDPGEYNKLLFEGILKDKDTILLVAEIDKEIVGFEEIKIDRKAKRI